MIFIPDKSDSCKCTIDAKWQTELGVSFPSLKNTSVDTYTWREWIKPSHLLSSAGAVCVSHQPPEGQATSILDSPTWPKEQVCFSQMAEFLTAGSCRRSLTQVLLFLYLSDLNIP